MGQSGNLRDSVVILDLDGTLVDSVHQHVVAWQQAFHDVGLHVANTEIHAAIGMGGDRLVAHVAGDAAEWAVGDEVRKAHDVHFGALLHSVSELDGASDLVRALSRHHTVVLASSGERAVTEELLSLVESASLLAATVSGSDVDQSKPAPDLLLEAAASVDAPGAVVVGDSVWDVRAAEACGFPSIGLLSGGIGSDDLTHAGAGWVFDGPRDLLTSLDTNPQWLRSASISSDLSIEERPSMPISAARSCNSSTVQSS